MKFPLALLIAAAAPHADWQDSLTPNHPGPIPEIRAFDAEYRFGWSDIDAAHAKVSVKYADDQAVMKASGGTDGLARILWQLDATQEAFSRRPNFDTIYAAQIEKYANRTIETQIVARPDGTWRLREVTPAGESPARWKNIKLSPLRDLFSAMLFIRSQALAPGNEVHAIIFPGDAPFLVRIKSLGTDPLIIAGTTRDALKLDIRIQRINIKKNNSLEEHKKFSSGKIWLSNDADRIPLRAEVSIFIGYVFAELVSARFENARAVNAASIPESPQ